MKLLHTWIRAIIILLVVACSTWVSADSGKPDASAGDWQSQPNGIELALTLTTYKTKESQKSIIKVLIKNTSSSVKEYSLFGRDSGFQILTLDSNGVWQPLRDYNPNHGSPSGGGMPIGPGQVISRTIKLSPTELAIVKTHSVKCSFTLYEPTTNLNTTVESLPQTMTETIVSGNDK